MDPGNPTAMIEMFESLPEERREALAQWFALQRLIAERLGVEKEEWFGLIHEALQHPFDPSIVAGAKPGSAEGADLQTIEKVREKLGEKTVKNGLEGEGIVEASKRGGLEQELLQRFQAQRIKFDGRSGRKGRGSNGRVTR